MTYVFRALSAEPSAWALSFLQWSADRDPVGLTVRASSSHISEWVVVKVQGWVLSVLRS